MAHGTYDNPRAGTNGSKNRMQKLTDKVNGKKKMSYTGSDLNKLKKDFPESHFRYESNIKHPSMKGQKEVWQVYPKSKAFGKNVTPGNFQADPNKYSTIAKEHNINNPSSENIQYYRQYK